MTFGEGVLVTCLERLLLEQIQIDQRLKYRVVFMISLAIMCGAAIASTVAKSGSNINKPYACEN